MFAATVHQLARLFGAEAAQPKTTLLKNRVADPLTTTAADQSGGDWQRRVTFAGSETSLTEPGYLAVAVVTSNRAAATIIAALTA